MDDFSGILPSDFSLKSQGKGPSMAARSVSSHNPKSSNPSGAFDDILVGGRAGSVKRTGKSIDDSFHFDWSGGAEKSSSAPVYDKPLYDEDIYGVAGMKTSSSVNYVDIFSSLPLPPNEGGAFDDLGNLGKPDSESISMRNQRFGGAKKGVMDFDDLVPGFAGSNLSDRHTVDIGQQHQKPTVPASKSISNTLEEPFVVLDSPSGKSADPLDRFSNPSTSENVKVHNSSSRGTVFDDLNPLDDLGKAVPEKNCHGNARSGTENSFDMELGKKAYARSPVNLPHPTVSIDNNLDSQQSFFGMPAASSDPYNSVGPASPPYVGNVSSEFEESLESPDDVWLTVSEIPLFTEPTSVPPPARPPPPKPAQLSKEDFFRDSKGSRKMANEFSIFSNSAQYVDTFKPPPTTARETNESVMDEFEDFATARDQNEGLEANSAAAAMKDAVDRATAEFRYAKEVRVKENVKTSRSKESGYFERDENFEQVAQEKKAMQEKQERLGHERRQREREEEREKKIEMEREQKKMEMERERAKEIERERLLARQAVERATREARERAASEARLKAERLAVGKANAEARERAERIAVQRAQAEARERAAFEAKERAEKAASEARERANAEIKEKGRERASLSKAETEARLRAERAAVERAAAEARERAASSARASHQKKEDDFESFFTMGARPSSAPRPRANSSDSGFDTQSQNKQGSEAAKRTSTGASSSIKKASSSLNIVDDLTSIFGAARSSSDFQDVEGETEDRRQARLERHQRTQERASKALADKNERDLQMQRDQAERHRIAETLDIEIKRWAAGKDGNLRALLSTLQYVLWPECGWQAVSLTDLITGASVKKVYRKATLCIHPDKVQQKGANIQQKYIAEKVFDLLKEAWNKFNSEELF